MSLIESNSDRVDSTIISRNPTLLNDKKGYIQMFTE